MKKPRRLPSPEHADTLSLHALRGLVTGLVDQVNALASEVRGLRAENAALREENAALRLENTRLKVDNQLLRDEIAWLKNLPPRPLCGVCRQDSYRRVVCTSRHLNAVFLYFGHFIDYRAAVSPFIGIFKRSFTHNFRYCTNAITRAVCR